MIKTYGLLEDKMKRIIIPIIIAIVITVGIGAFWVCGEPSDQTSNETTVPALAPNQDSRQFFPIGLVDVDDPRDFPEIAAAGFNVVQI